MQSKALTYTAFALFSLMLSLGAVNVAFADVSLSAGPRVLLCAIVPGVLILALALVNYHILVPRYFLRQRYAVYAAWCVVLSLAVPLLGVALEAAVRDFLGVTHRIHDYLSPWILLDSLSTASLLCVIMAGMGMAQVYRRWRRQTRLCDEAARRYADAIRLYKSRLRPSEILASLRRVGAEATADPDAANRTLRTLSERLRHELYDIPRMNFPSPGKPAFSRLEEFVSAKRYTLLRDISLKLLIACVSVTALFEAPDRPDFSLSGLVAFFGMFVIISLLTYGNKSLCKHFLNKGRIRLYLTAAFGLLVAITAAAIIFQILSYNPTLHNGSLPPLYSVIGTFSSFCTILLYFGGITALILLHNWLRTVRRVASLQAETAKAELNFLQSQINPHFLFNVLNNVGILIYEEPEASVEMIAQLRQMFEYQERIADKERVEVADEVEFMRNYLLLEQSRKSGFEFSIDVADDCLHAEIPSLLLIPFVENAAKHSTGRRDIRISLRRKAKSLTFTVSNICGPKRHESDAGGLGIANTRRRLGLIYGDDYTLSTRRENDLYKVTLTIPL